MEWSGTISRRWSRCGLGGRLAGERCSRPHQVDLSAATSVGAQLRVLVEVQFTRVHDPPTGWNISKVKKKKKNKKHESGVYEFQNQYHLEGRKKDISVPGFCNKKRGWYLQLP